jgi:hypothetical protein
LNDTQTVEYVQTHNLVAFFLAGNSSDATTAQPFFANKFIKLCKGSVTLYATIVDTCGDTDCDGCCTENAQPTGALVDMEYWTVIKHFENIDAADGQIEYTIYE